MRAQVCGTFGSHVGVDQGTWLCACTVLWSPMVSSRSLFGTPGSSTQLPCREPHVAAQESCVRVEYIIDAEAELGGQFEKTSLQAR